MTKQFQAIISAYSQSKILRLGIAYLETDIPFRGDLVQQLGISAINLSKYAYSARQFFPLTKLQKSDKPDGGRWSDEDENYLMDSYRQATIEEIEQTLSNRTRQAIQKKASLLGVTR